MSMAIEALLLDVITVIKKSSYNLYYSRRVKAPNSQTLVRGYYLSQSYISYVSALNTIILRASLFIRDTKENQKCTTYALQKQLFITILIVLFP